MNFQEFVIQFESQPPPAVIEMERRWCACHCKQIWVLKGESGPVFCTGNQKLLPAGVEHANL